MSTHDPPAHADDGARLVARAARRGQVVSGQEPHRRGRGAHLLLGALDLPRADRARLAAGRGRLARARSTASCGSPRTSARARRSTRCDRRSRTSSTSRAAPASRWCSASLAALWSASGYIGAFMRASNEIYGVEEDRPFYKLRPLQLLMTLVMTIVVALVLIGLVLTGPLATAIGEEIGFGDEALTIWSIAKWPLLFVVVVIDHRAPLPVLAQRPPRGPALDPSRQRRRDRASGSSPRPASASTSPTSAPTRAPTAASRAGSSCCSGSGSRTSRWSSARSSRPSSSAPRTPPARRRRPASRSRSTPPTARRRRTTRPPLAAPEPYRAPGRQKPAAGHDSSCMNRPGEKRAVRLSV